MGTNKSHVNENYQHACDSTKFKLEGYRAPLSDCFTPDELSGLFRFYVLQAPIAKDKTALSTQRTLTSLGWNGPSIKILERKLLKASGITSFIFIGSQTIDGTLENMALDKEICAKHPRAVLHKDVKLTLREDNSIERRSGDENRMQCLFRHLRNGIAHGQTYLFPTGLVLIED